jgi:serine/threonine-protein kinase HipA
MEAPSRPQSIGVGAFGPASTVKNALSQCGRFLLTEAEARALIEEIKTVVAGWRQVYAEAGISKQDIYTLAGCFSVAEQA